MTFAAEAALELAYTSQALATLGASAEWDAAIAKLLATRALRRADEHYGAKSAADESAAWVRIHLEERFGKGWKFDPRAANEVDVLDRADKLAEDTHHEQFTSPFWAAMRDLTHTPAPTLAAACFKQFVIDHEEVWNDSEMTGNCMQIVTDDFARLLTCAPDS